MVLWILLGTLFVLLTISYGWYASIVSYRNRVQEALGSVDAHLRQRHDLLPNILTIAQKFMQHERDLLTKIAELRAAATAPYRKEDPQSVAAHLQSESALTAAMGRLFAVAESNPDLKSQEAMVRSQETFEVVEGHITAARRFYNSAVAQLNNAVQIFPGPIFARIAKVQALPFYEETDAAVRAPIDAGSYLK